MITIAPILKTMHMLTMTFAEGGHAATAPALLLHGPTSLESESSEPVSPYSTISTYLTTLPSSLTTNSSLALPRNPETHPTGSSSLEQALPLNLNHQVTPTCTPSKFLPSPREEKKPPTNVSSPKKTLGHFPKQTRRPTYA